MDRDLLLNIEKPSRYLGGEVNQVRKQRAGIRCRVGLCYPDVYEIGTSHLGLHVLYEVVNDRDDMAAERVFCPWPDMETALRRSGQPLTTLESNLPLSHLDVLGFTLQFELSATNLLTVLDLGGIPFLSAQRDEDDPVVIAGGPCAYNPEPLAEILDAVCLGDGEEMLPEVCEVVARWRERGGTDRPQLLRALAEVEGVYVPSLYRVHQDPDGIVTGVEPLDGVPTVVRRRILADLDAAAVPARPVVPFGKAVHDRLAVEIQRGCARGCRFCQAGILYRPVRERSPARIREAVRVGLQATGADEIGLLSLSTGDYTCLPDLLASLSAEHGASRVSLSMPSLRLETLTGGLLDEVREVRRSGITLAPEAGTARLRAVINKTFDENLLLDAIRSVLSRGWRGIKLYFMCGLPTEQRDDLQGIVDLVHRCRVTARSTRRNATLRVSVSTFVPKPHTPFQWAAQVTRAEADAKQRWLIARLRGKGLEARSSAVHTSWLEGVISRGDRRVGRTVLEAWRRGARLDGWQDRCDPDLWEGAFAATGVDPVAIASRWRDREEILPWDHLSCGVDRDWLWDELDAALESAPRHDCTTGACHDCGICDPPRVRNQLFDLDQDDRGARAVVDRRPREGRTRHEPRPPQQEILDTRLPQTQRRRIRVQYGRTGPAAMLSHLETVTVLQRALRRSEVPVLHTAGFNPHIKMSFTDPNPLGMESDAELFEVEVSTACTADRLLSHLRDELPDGFTLYEARRVPTGTPSLAAQLRSATYRIRGIERDVAHRAASRLGEPMEVIVQRKKGPRQVDVSRVAHIEPVDDTSMLLTLKAGAGVKPAEVVEALLGADAAPSLGAYKKVNVTLAALPGTRGGDS